MELWYKLEVHIFLEAGTAHGFATEKFVSPYWHLKTRGKIREHNKYS